MSRIVLLLLLAALFVAAPARAAEPPPVDAAAGSLLAKQRAAATRTGMGLPPYKAILGKRWKAKVARADAKLVGALAPDARAAAVPGDGAVRAGDVLRRGAERQKRRVRLAVALNSMCPVFDKTNPEFATTITAKGRVEEVIATVERVKGYEITTIVTLDAEIQGRSEVNGRAELWVPSADWGTYSVVRQQTARNLRTGKVRPTGPTQRSTGSVDPFFNPEHGFGEFIERYGDEDESPAPRRPLRTRAWDQVEEQLTGMLGAAMYAELKKAEKHFRTENACVTLDVPAPVSLSPGERVNLTGILHARQGNPTPRQILGSARIYGYLENDQGQTAASHASYPLDPGEVWYEFIAPKKKWSNSRPIGVEIIATTEGGIASKKVYFKYREAKIPPRFSAKLSVTSEGAGGYFRDMEGAATYTLREANPGPDGSLNAWYDVESSTVSRALQGFPRRDGCRYEATGTGNAGTFSIGDLELRVLPDGQMVYAFMLWHEIPTSYFATDCPPGTFMPPIPLNLSAHLDTRRPGPASQSLRPLPGDFHDTVSGATDVSSALMDTNSADWTLTPLW